MFDYWKQTFNFALSSRQYSFPEGVKGGGLHIEKAFIIRFVFGVSEPRKFQISVKNMATIDVHSGMIIHVPAYHV